MLVVGCLLGFIVNPGASVPSTLPDPLTNLTEAKCLQLRQGMSIAQVAAIAGGQGSVIDGRRVVPPIPFPDPFTYLGKWKGKGIALTAWFNADGQLTEAFYELQPGDELKVIPKLCEKP